MNLLKAPLGKRRQLFEIQDFPWCPKGVRDGVTDLLNLNLKLVPLYDPAINFLIEMMKKSGPTWIDLCAGAGGGSLPLHEKLEQVTVKKINLTLTDLYPHGLEKDLPRVSYYPGPVDARDVPSNIKGMRTLFTSFHHLSDDVARDVLRNAFSSNTAIGAFEFTERNFFCLLMTFPTIVFSFFLVPFIFPWKLSRFFWTYFIPLIPIVATVDVILSCFRTRTPKELEALVASLKKKDYVWKIGKVPSAMGFSMTYIVGLPVSD